MPDTDPTPTPRIWTPGGEHQVTSPEVVDATLVDDDAPGPLPATTGPGTDVVPHAGPSTALFDTTDPGALLEQAAKVATVLDDLVSKQGLRVNMGTRAKPRWHLEVDAWQTLGTLLGCVPHLEYSRPWKDPGTGDVERVTYTARVEHYEGRGEQRRLARITTYDVDGYSWEARVVIERNGAVVGEGEALCRRTEQRWGRADDYAVKSMAITRATSRAYKQAAGWVAVLAGYQATPAAEVDPHQSDRPPYGPDADGKIAASAKRAIRYLINPDGIDSDDDVLDDIVEETITEIIGMTNGYFPAVVGRAVGIVARTARQHNDPDHVEAPAP